MTIEERLGRLERQNRVMKGGLGLLLVAAIAGGVLGFAGQQKGAGVPDEIRAKQFIVVDDAGNPVIGLTSDEHGGRIATHDDAGVLARISHRVSRHGGLSCGFVFWW